MKRTRRRRIVAGVILLSLATLMVIYNPGNYQPAASPSGDSVIHYGSAIDALNSLPVKGRAPATGYDRSNFGAGWLTQGSCSVRNQVLLRDLSDVVVDDRCRVLSGKLQDPYTGRLIEFTRGVSTSADIQIDHVVALSDAWQKGAQQLSYEQRQALANDPLELLAVSGDSNQQKSNGDAATWLPPNKPFRCQYIARQIAVKQKYKLWVTAAEAGAMRRVLTGCPGQQLPVR